MNPYPKKGPSASQSYTERLKAQVGKIETPEFKEWKPDAETLRIWDRAQNPYRRFQGDGR
jgi:hypothetical protein